MGFVCCATSNFKHLFFQHKEFTCGICYLPSNVVEGLALSFSRKGMITTKPNSNISSSHASQLELVEDPTPEKNYKRKCLLWGFGCLSMAVIALFCSLYVVEVQKERLLHEKIRKTDIEKEIELSEPCFERSRARFLPNIQSEEEIMNAGKMAALDLHTIFITEKYESMSVSVHYMGEKLWELQLKSEDSLVTPTGDTPYPIASVSKVFTVVMLHKLIDKGIIKSVDDQLDKYVPEVQIKNPFDDQKLTFRHLSCMMSGLQREAPCYPFNHKNYCPYSTREMLQRLRNSSLVMPPDKLPSYSNLGMALLGRLLEQMIQNQTIENWMEENIFKTLGMKNTGFDVLQRKSDIPTSAHQDGSRADLVNWGWASPSGGMYSSSNDLGMFSRIFLNKAVLKRGSLHHMLDMAFVWPDSNAQGCPFEVYPIDPYREDDKKRVAYLGYAKDGSVFGYGSMFGFIPDLKLNINVLGANRLNSARNAWNNVAKHFTKAIDQLLKRKTKKYVLPPNVDAYIGTYKSVSDWPLIKNPVMVYMHDNVLLLKLEWFTTMLTYYKDWTLESRNYNKNTANHRCFMLGLGLLHEKYIFTSPKPNRTKCESFFVNGITSYGYAKFRRIE